MSDKQTFKMTGSADLTGFPNPEMRDIPVDGTVNDALLKWRQEAMGPTTFKTMQVERLEDGRTVLTFVPYAEGESPPPALAPPPEAPGVREAARCVVANLELFATEIKGSVERRREMQPCLEEALKQAKAVFAALAQRGGEGQDETV